MSTSSKQSDLRVLVACDFPQKQDVLTVKSSATLGELKSAAAAKLGIESSASASASASAKGKEAKDAKSAAAAPVALAGYGVVLVGYGAMPVDHSDRKPTATLAELGLADLTTVLLSAPVAIKPKKYRPASRDAKEDKEDAAAAADKKKRKGGDDDREFDDYKGLTAANAIKKWQDSTGKKKKLAFEYIEMYATEILKRKDFADLKREVVRDIVKSDRLNVEKEVVVFEAVVAWGRAEIKRQKLENAKDATAGGAQLAKTLDDLWPLVRLPCMELSDVASKVEATKMLDQNQMLGLFTYLGQRAALGSKDDKKIASIAIDKSLAAFVKKPRDPRPIIGAWEFSPVHKNYNCVLSDKNKVCRTPNTTTYQHVLVNYDKPMKKGKHTLKFRVDTTGQWFFAGIASPNMSVQTTYSYSDQSAWGWANQGQEYRAGNSNGQNGFNWANGDTGNMVLDIDSGSLTINITNRNISQTVTGLPPRAEGWCFHFIPYTQNTTITLL